MIGDFFYSIFFYIYLILSILIWGNILFFLSFFKDDPHFYHQVVRRWSKSILFYSRAKITIKGLDNIDPEKGYLIICNHQSSFDIYLLASILPLHFRFISKKLYFKLPVIGKLMKRADYIKINRKDRKQAFAALTHAAQLLKNGSSILIFPEGTRSKTGEIAPFKAGTLHVIKECGDINILPVVINGARDINKKKSLMIKKALVTLTIDKPVHYNKNDFITSAQQKKIITGLEEKIKKIYNRN